MDSKMQTAATLWRSGKIFGNHIPRIGEGTRKPDSGWSSVPGSCAYADRDTAKIFGSQVVGYIKGKSAIAIARRFVGRQKNFTGQNFWARGYYESTAGRDEATIRRYIQEQEAEDKRQDEQELFKDK
jgi:hypothetical protein